MSDYLNLSVSTAVTNYLILVAISARLQPSLSSSLYLLICFYMMCFWAKLNIISYHITEPKISVSTRLIS